MGAVVETPSIFPDMTAKENLNQQYRILGLPSYDGREELLQLVGLSDTQKKKAKNFSLGMRQRLGIAIALVGNPDFLVLDELARLATHYGFIDAGHMVKEISTKELESVCQKCVRIEVSDTKILARILDRKRIEYRILSENTADIFGTITVSELALLLDKENCSIISMQERGESLESYYLNLLGGEYHA